VIADDRRHMDRNTFGEVATAFGHVPRDVSPKHGPHTLQCIKCNEAGVHVNGQMMPSLLEEKCFGQPLPREEPVEEVDMMPYAGTDGPQFDDKPVEDTDATDERPPVDVNQQIGEAQLPEKDGTPKTRSTRRDGDVPANLRV
jgi:hypothetical protein